MYTEEIKVKNTSSLIKNLLVGILLIILLIFIFAWFFPTKNSLNPLYQDIFRNNLNSMRDAAETYFTNERMPSKVNGTVKLTLQQMLDKHLLLPFLDKDGKSCDTTKSYVEITKKETEYEMKVNLVCPTEEAYIIEHLGCTDKCNTCTKEDLANLKDEICACVNGSSNKNNNSNDKGYTTTIKEYQYVRDVKSTKTTYTCDAGYTKKSDNMCYKTVTTTDKKDATPVYKTSEESIDATKTEKTQKVYKYLYVLDKEKQYSNWSDWSANKEYTSNDKITWGKQELVWNEKNGGKKITKTTYKEDKNSPIYQYTYDYVIGSYNQKVCDGYKYFIDGTTSKLYQSGNYYYVETITSDKKLNDTKDTRYVLVDRYYDHCEGTCTLRSKLVYKVYKRDIKEVTQTSSSLGATCNVVTKTINIYGTRKIFKGYDVIKTVSEEYVYYYHTKTRTVTQEAVHDEKWSTSANDKDLLSKGYVLEKKVVDKEEKTYELSCPKSYTLKGEKCYKNTTVISSYKCSEGKLSDKVCIITKTETLKKEAKKTTNVTTGKEYKWSSLTSIAGWEKTGKTRTRTVTTK